MRLALSSWLLPFPLILLVLLGAAAALLIRQRPSSLFAVAAGIAIVCLALLVAALLARRRRPLNRAPELEAMEHWIAQATAAGDRPAALHLLTRLTDWPHRFEELDAEVRAAVGRLAADTGADRTLLSWSDEPRPRDRQLGAIQLLPWLRPPGTEERLIRLADDPEDDVAHAAYSALVQLGTDTALEAVILGIGGRGPPPSRLAALLEAAPPERLLPLLERHAIDDSKSRRFWAAYLAGLSTAPEALPLLLRLSTDPDADVRANAAEALGSHPIAEARERLHELLRDPSWVVQSHVAKALGQMGPLPSLEQLVALLASPQWWVRDNAARALENAGTAAFPGLRRQLRSLRGERRRWVAYVLVHLGFLEWLGARGRARSARADLLAMEDAGVGAAIPAALRAWTGLPPAGEGA